MTIRGNVIAEARFDSKLKRYLLLQGAGFFLVSIIGIPFIPFWLVLGRRWAERRYEMMSCVLTDRALVLKQGVWFRNESTVPLDRIQDVSVQHGPLLDRLGLATMRVETAGASAGAQSGINLTGVVDTAGFRDMVLEARDRASGWTDDEAPALDRAAAGKLVGTAGNMTAAPDATRVATGNMTAAPETTALLGDIRDSLGRIEELLAAERDRHPPAGEPARE